MLKSIVDYARYFSSRKKIMEACNLRNGSKTRGALNQFLSKERLKVEHLKYLAAGSGLDVPVYDPKTGKPLKMVPNVDLNLIATKPLLAPVQLFANFLETHFRQNIGRGSGPKAESASRSFEEAREIISDFFGCDREGHVVIFTDNTTRAMNKLVQIAKYNPDTFFVVSPAAHHSTMLPPRETGRSAYFRLHADGTYDLNDLEQCLKIHHERKKHLALCIESESNVTGYKNDIYQICKMAAKYGAFVFIDHSQGASNMGINLSELPGKVFLAISGHKLFARDGSGAVIGPRDFFNIPAPEPGGDTIVSVTRDQVHYSKPPYNLEPGTPAYIAQVSLAKAVSLLSQAGLDEIEKEESRLLAELWRNVTKVPGVEVLGNSDLNAVPRGPIFTFSVRDCYGNLIPPGFIGAAMQAFYGYDTRVGMFCAHPLLYFLLGASAEEEEKHAQIHIRKGKAGCAALEGDEKWHASRFGLSFTTKMEQIMPLADILGEIRNKLWNSEGNCKLKLDRERGEFYLEGQPRGFMPRTFAINQYALPRYKLTIRNGEFVFPPVVMPYEDEITRKID